LNRMERERGNSIMEEKMKIKLKLKKMCINISLGNVLDSFLCFQIQVVMLFHRCFDQYIAPSFYLFIYLFLLFHYSYVHTRLG
jgi:hypothetical protein